LGSVNLLPFSDEYDRAQSFEKENKLFVKLAILSQQSVDRDWKNHERQFHIEQMFAPKKTIDMVDILVEDVPLTVVSGIAGIGKSTLVKQIIGSWSNGEVWNRFGEFASPLVVIPVRCRDLNNENIKEDTEILDIIRKLHPDLAAMENTDFQQIRKRIVFLLDGIDELIDVKSITEENIKPTAKLLKDILTNNKAFCHWRVKFKI